jgi:hypothetical protein
VPMLMDVQPFTIVVAVFLMIRTERAKNITAVTEAIHS